ncbi:MAG: hypothetical protein ACE5LF_02390, partial [Alphaproteobacteria bacterium]
MTRRPDRPVQGTSWGISGGTRIRLVAGLAMLVGAAAYVASEASGQAQVLVIVVAGVVGMYMA